MISERLFKKTISCFIKNYGKGILEKKIKEDRPFIFTIFWDDLERRLQSSVLYLYGRASKFPRMAEMNVEFLKTHLPDFEIISFEDGIHNLELQKPKEVAELILEFLNRDRIKGEQQVFQTLQ